MRSYNPYVHLTNLDTNDKLSVFFDKLHALSPIKDENNEYTIGTAISVLDCFETEIRVKENTDVIEGKIMDVIENQRKCAEGDYDSYDDYF